jgi:hypothetical protein
MNSKMLPFGQMKLVLVISFVLPNLTSCPPQVLAQQIEPVRNPGDNASMQFEPPQPLESDAIFTGRRKAGTARVQFNQLPPLPDNGTPTGRRRGGTGRDGCPALNTPITALVPGEETTGEVQEGNSTKSSSKSFLATTVAEYPSFWIYLPDLPTNLRTGEFVLQDRDGNDIYRSPITLPETPGIIGISLPSNPQYSLKTDQQYHWYFKVYCGALQKTSEYFYVDAWVQRVAMTPDLENKLKTAKSREYVVYADNSIWYDAVTNLADLRRTDSQNAMFKDDWTDLLKAVSLQDIAQAPIIQRYSLGQ